MHASSMENMEKCYRNYIAEQPSKKNLKVLDIGGADVNGSYSDIFNEPEFEYVAANIQPGEGVSIVLDDPNKLPFENNTFDIVLSGQMLEHCPFFWVMFSEMVRVLSDTGLIFLIAPSSGPIHRHLVDCYRFYPDSYRALASYSNCHLIDIWQDNRGPWNDLVGIFNKSGIKPVPHQTGNVNSADAINNKANIIATSFNKIQGSENYLDVLKRLHKSLRPTLYLEIGVRHGRSLSLANCSAVGIDPYPDIQMKLPDSTIIIEKTSDDFFETAADSVFQQKPDLVFIDGMHLFEYALRDFMNVELHSNPNTVVIIDDIFPNEPEQASRERNTRVWTGDVWKLYLCLKKYRQDLCFIPLDTSPTGLLLITGLKAENRTLWQRYNPIVREILALSNTPPTEVLNRKNAICPSGHAFKQCLNIINFAKDNHEHLAKHREAIIAAAYPVQSPPYKLKKLKLSVVVISYNMARELPRTLKSLSPAMQIGLKEEEYEIIVVDNSSSHPFDQALCQSFCSNIRFLSSNTKSISPAEAINTGIAHARGDLIGVMIDGARIASPGLLHTALNAAKINPCAVIGSLSFHLGNSVQVKSVKNGYNQKVEDELLATVPWEEDGYRLFDISVFAASSSKGWLSLPDETNAFFMHKNLWQSLDGFDERFQQPGGGIVNHDTWFRACNHPGSHVIMLLGEATFHQFHDGVATNALKSNWEQYCKEYEEIRGHKYHQHDVVFTHFSNRHTNLEDIILNSTSEREDARKLS